MTRQRTPTSLLEAAGTFKHNPSRGLQRANEPEVHEPIPAHAPQHLPDDVQAAWHYIVPLIPEGVAKVVDAPVVEQLCSLYAIFREDPKAFQVAQHGEMRRLLGALGMTPADRSKVSAPKKDTNPFTELMQ